MSLTRLLTLLLSLVSFSGSLLLSSRAHAQSANAAQTQAAMDDWYSGERRDAYLFLGVGVLTAGGGTFLATRDDELAKGAGYTTLGLGVLTSILAITYNLSLDSKHDELTRDLKADPSGYKKRETQRLQGIADRFDLYRWAEIGAMFVGAGLASYGTLSDKEAFTGAGMALAGEALVLITLDYFASRRVHRYLDVVQDFDPATSSSALGGGGGFMLQHAGAF
ncbi:MAG: hypothetical protein AB7K71_22855 [Polyangiaceae bacterium]